MNISWKVCSILVVLFQTAATAQQAPVVLQVIDGKTGKPIVRQHLLLFAGDSLQNAERHQQSFERVTDGDGQATLDVSGDVHWVQVWIDWHVICQGTPYAREFNVEKIVSAGTNTPNTCGSHARTAEPGHLVLFVREESFWEKMRH